MTLLLGQTKMLEEFRNFWREIKDNYEIEEIVEDWNQGDME